MSLEGWKAFFEIGSVVLLLLTFAFAAGALIVNNRLNAIQARELADFGLKVATANQRAAEASEKAEQERLARVKIEERLAGWQLEPEARARLTERLKAFAKTPFDLSVNPREASFMETLNGVLEAAGWSLQAPKFVGTPPQWATGSVACPLVVHDKACMITSAGISIEIAQERMKDFERAGAALMEGLTAEGIPAKAVKVTPDPNPNSIHVVIGSRE